MYICWPTFSYIVILSVGSPCVSAVQVLRRTCSTITYSWKRLYAGLQYRAQVCPEGSLSCSNYISCHDCTLLTATDLSSNSTFSFTLDSVSNGRCVSLGCQNNSVIASTEPISKLCVVLTFAQLMNSISLQDIQEVYAEMFGKLAKSFTLG